MFLSDWSRTLAQPAPAPREVTAVAAALLVTLLAVGSLRAGRNRIPWRTQNASAPMPWGRSAVTLLGTVAAAAALSLVPALRWGWWPALGGWGSAVTGVSSALPGAWRVLAALAACGCWVWAGPTIAAREERAWRSGTAGRTRAARGRRALLFAVLHCASGMPLAWALALVVPALRLTATVATADDEAEGLRRAAQEHATVNAMVACLALVVAVTSLR